MWGHNMCGGVSHIVWMCVCGCGCERVIMNVNVGVHMGICVWALTVRKYDCMCVRVVHFRAHCMSEHECVCYCSVPESCLTLCDPMDCITPSPTPEASLSITNSWSLFKLTFVELVMPSNHLIHCHPLLLLPWSFPASRSFAMSHLFASGGQSIGVSASTSVLPVNVQDSSPLRWTGCISLQSKGHSESSPAPQFKSINSLALSFLYSPILTSIHDYWKNHSFDWMELVGKVMSLLLNMLPSLVITFLSRSNHLLIYGCSHHLQWFWSPSK